MSTVIQQPQALENIARLEKQNRRLKRVGLFLFLLCFLGIGVIGWKLNRFSRLVTVYPNGVVKFNRMGATEFTLYDKSGKTQGLLTALDNSAGAVLFLNGPGNKTGLMFNGTGDGSTLSLMNPSGDQQVTLNTGSDFAWVTVGEQKDSGDKIEMTAGARGAENLSVTDKAGFKAVLGSASLINANSGATSQTSVASLTLFGKDGHIIWMTPKP